MLKKFLFIFLLLFSVFGLAACNDDNKPKETESVDVPVNLVISDKVLTWDAVAKATGYIVYVNDVEKATVTTTSYDFSALSEEKLVFQVVAKAPKGMTNSQKSAALSYTTAAVLSAPANLAFKGKVLTWDAVKQATGYIVYVNNVEKATVTSNSYDFSALTGDKLLFQVVAKAPKGMADSPKSASITYTAAIVLSAPVNLAFNGKVLTWDAVKQATEYIVYVNDVEKATVTTTSYDFSSLSGDNLVFQVVAKAPKGMVNSPKSAALTYSTTAAEISAPVNLEISGKVLTWDAVKQATGYIIYVNDVEKATVTTTSYNFSALTGDKLVFQVVAKAPKGMNNSAKSVMIAYIANPTAEITAVKNLLDEIMPEVSDIAAEELVRKGMTGADVEALKAAVETLLADMEAADGDPVLSNAALKTFLATKFNIEALVSTGLVLAGPGIDEEIANIEEEIDWYQNEIDQYGPSDYYQSRIDELTNEKEMLINMKAMIASSRDEMVLVATKTVDYLITLQTKVTDDFILNVQNLVESNGPRFLTADEIVVVKDEFVDLFMDNLPSVDDLKLVYELLATGYGQFLEDNDLTALLSDLSTAFATSTNLSIKFSLKMLDAFDKAFFEEVLALVNGEDSEQIVQSEIIILVITYLKNFKDANQALIDEIEAVFTDEQKESLYQGYLQTMLKIMETSGGELPFSLAGMQLSYALIEGSFAVFEDMMDKALTKFVTTDGELLRKIVISDSFVYDWDWENDVEYYYNEATGETYDNWDDFYNAQNEAELAVIKEALTYYAPTLGTLSNAQITTLIDMIVASVPVEAIATELDMTADEAQALVDLAEGLLGDVLPNLHTLVKNYMDYVVTNDLITKIKALEETIASYEGEDFEEYDHNMTIIFISKHLDAFLTSANQSLVRGIISDVATFVKDESIYPLLGASSVADVTEMETMVNDTFDELVTLVSVIKDYNAETLTLEQEEKIIDFSSLVEFLFGGPAE
ncbi:MAG TPA: hypothetical protein PLW60_00130 [Bacilli bacterium]|nr:MAG: hypothetical protein BWY97_00304 [Tenericutes bacterium ADurb.BinA124]HNZ50195.1 hypothetical protein [Bacilli bacterium]HPX83779.1 hypothetical protein [Bacilli bacterium]HQC73918.1 hypothetical protein [Bacilli bacterium]